MAYSLANPFGTKKFSLSKPTGSNAGFAAYASQPTTSFSLARPTGSNAGFVNYATPAPAPPAETKPARQPPPDPAYEQQMLAYGGQRDTTIAGLRDARTRTLQDYGYTGQFDQNDALTPGSLQFDPNNPFSRAALMLRTYNNSQRGNTNSYAARGQLYSGALQNAKDATAFNYQAQDDALIKSLISNLAGNTGAIASAGNTYDINAANAYAQRLGRTL